MINKGIITLALLQLYVCGGMGQIEIISVISTSGNHQFGSGNQQFSSGNGAPSSPCPNIFQYQYSRTGWIGKIAVPPSSALGSNGRLVPVRLNLQMTLPATLPRRIPGRRFTIINLDHTFQPYTISGGGGGPVVVAQPEKENEDDKYAVYEVVTSSSGDFLNYFFPDSCGRPLSSTHLIAFGETVSKRGDWPWVVALFHNKVEEAGIRFACGGTLISRLFVLTAAHCAVRLGERMHPDLLTVHLGKFNLSNWFETGVQIRAIKFIHWHPDYNSLPDADLAVLELSVPAEFSSFVRPACIWPPDKADLALIVGRIGLVVGWGKDENNKILTSTPKLARSPIVSQEDCLRSNNGFSSITSSRTFCAGFRNGTGPCSGDSGGGFMMSIPDEEHGGFKWYLRGVVSTSLETNQQVKCDLNQYVVFADVAKQRAWISQFIAL
ncbi:hypothetical protein J437_LFUL015099 [Ladona fulva]|uniref:Peptidase S1 domain-containing protein n=1 Tax=Ladona fulva TaxID=123851 RepID=A0A8K0NY83_LADFU|nr:hypothetical protein J437_LFUL015099 [Ladona fulva]